MVYGVVLHKAQNPMEHGTENDLDKHTSLTSPFAFGSSPSGLDVTFRPCRDVPTSPSLSYHGYKRGGPTIDLAAVARGSLPLATGSKSWPCPRKDPQIPPIYTSHANQR